MAKKRKKTTKKRAKAKTAKKKTSQKKVVKKTTKKAAAPKKTKKSFNSTASMVLGIISLILFVAYVIIAFVGKDTNFTYLLIGSLVIITFFISVLGLGLGIADMINKKSNKKPVLGIVLNSIILFLIVLLIVIGLIIETLA